MIKVLHVLYSMNRGGIETFIMNVFRNIDRTKVSFDFLLGTENECDYNKEILALGGNIHYIPDCRNGLFKNIKMLNRFYKEHPEYKIIHLHASALLNIVPLVVAKKHNIPVRIIHSHSTSVCGNPLRNLLHIFNKLWLTYYATHYLACSKLAGEWMFSSKYKKTPYQIINNGIDIDNFKFDPDKRNELRKHLCINDKFVVGHVGSFSKAKNHSFLLDIFSNIKEKSDDAILLLVGDGNLRKNIEDKIRKLGLSDSVILTGKRTDIAELMCAMDVFVFPSLHEGLPVTLVEAQASNLIIFASDAITDEIYLTANIKMLPLTLSSEKWAKKIIAAKNNLFQRHLQNNVLDKRYDIFSVINIIKDFYIKSLKEFSCGL